MGKGFLPPLGGWVDAKQSQNGEEHADVLLNSPHGFAPELLGQIEEYAVVVCVYVGMWV